VLYSPEPVLAYVDDAQGHHEISLLVHDGFLHGIEMVTSARLPATDWPKLSNVNLMVFEESPWKE
jgi:hypothetical protein